MSKTPPPPWGYVGGGRYHPCAHVYSVPRETIMSYLCNE